MRRVWRLLVRGRDGQDRLPYYSKDKSLTLRSAASWRKSGYKVRVDRLTLREAKAQDLHCRLYGWPLVFRDRGRLNNSRSFRRYRARVTRPRVYIAKDVTIKINGVELSQGIEPGLYSAKPTVAKTTKGFYEVTLTQLVKHDPDRSIR